MMFGGIVSRRGGSDPRAWISPEHLERLLDPYGVADRIGHLRNGAALLVQATRWNTPESRHINGPETCIETGRVLVGWVRLDNREALCASLGLENRSTLTDGQLILVAHRQWGRDAAPLLEGEFAFAIHDPADNTSWCVRDVMGTRPFFYHATAELFAFSSTAALFPALAGEHIAPSDAWMARYLLGYSHDHVRTAFEGVLRLPPAHEMLVEPGTVPQPRRYFTFEDPQPGIGKPDPARVETYREALDNAVRANLRSDHPIAAELSGGLDSSAIVASARMQMPADQPLHTVGLLMYEEDPVAQDAVAGHCGLVHHRGIMPDTGDWHRSTQERASASFGFPLEHPNAAYHFPVYQHCAAVGARTLLSGFGGDEIVTSGGREVYGELYDAGRYGDWWRAMGSSTRDRAKGAMRFLRARHGAEPELHPAQAVFLAQLETTPLRDDLVASEDLTAMQMQRGDIFIGRTANETILARAFRAYVSGRFESCSAMAASYGIEYRWPLVERRLVETFLAMPSIERHKGGIGRSLHRRANVGRLPAFITWHVKSMGGVLPGAQPREKAINVTNIDLLSPRLVSILDPLKYLNLGESFELRSQPGADFGNAGTYRRGLARRIEVLSDWLTLLEQ